MAISWAEEQWQILAEEQYGIFHLKNILDIFAHHASFSYYFKSHRLQLPVSCISQLRFRIIDDILCCPRRRLISTKNHLNFFMAEGAQLLHWEDSIEAIFNLYKTQLYMQVKRMFIKIT